MAKEVRHYCDQCGTPISHYDWEDGLSVYGVEVSGSISLKFSRKTSCGRSGSPPRSVNGGEFCSTKCAVKSLSAQIEKATSENTDWVCGVPTEDQDQ